MWTMRLPLTTTMVMTGNPALQPGTHLLTHPIKPTHCRLMTRVRGCDQPCMHACAAGQCATMPRGFTLNAGKDSPKFNLRCYKLTARVTVASVADVCSKDAACKAFTVAQVGKKLQACTKKKLVRLRLPPVIGAMSRPCTGTFVKEGKLWVLTTYIRASLITHRVKSHIDIDR